MELFKATTRKWIYFEQFALPAVNVVFTFVRRDLTEGDALPSLEVHTILLVHLVSSFFGVQILTLTSLAVGQHCWRSAVLCPGAFLLLGCAV